MEETNNSSSWGIDNNVFIPIFNTANQLPPGYYKPKFNSALNKDCLAKQDVVLPKLYELPNNVHETILKDIVHFWDSEERYRKFGNVYKRNILLYSVPGNGKTSLINLLAKTIMEKYNGIIVLINNDLDLLYYVGAMTAFRKIEPTRKIITVIEDFERFIKSETYYSILLQILDGNSQIDNAVTIATTNHPEELEKNITSRPSRFNLILEYPKPDENVRKYYISKKLSDYGLDVESDTVKENISRHVAVSDGYTFDYVKEYIQGIYVDGIPEEEMATRIETALKKNGNYKISENREKSIGF